MSFIQRIRGDVLKALTISTILAAGTSLAQNYASMSISDVIASADRAMQRRDYQAAIPALQEVISRTQNLSDPQGKQTAQTCRFELARVYYQLGDISTGMGLIEDYLDNEPRPQERVALRMLAQGFFDVQDWDKIIELAQRLQKFQDLDKDDLFNLNLLLGQAYFQKEEWEKCIEPLRYAEANTRDDKIRGICQVMVARAMVEAKQWSNLYGWITRVQRTDRKYDITLNLTLMKAGQDRFENGEYLNALMLYRMVLPRDALLDFANRQIAFLSKGVAGGNLSESDLEERKKEVEGIQESIKILKELPPYEEEVTFRIGQIYYDVKRYWEGFVLFDKLYEQDKTSEIGEAAIFQCVLVLYALNQVERAEERGLGYLNDRPDGKYARTTLSIIVRNRLLAQNFAGVIALKSYVDELPLSDDVNERMLQADIHYMMAFAYLQSGEYRLSVEQFETILDQYPDSLQIAEALYYHGMGYLLQADYESALMDFQAFQEKYEDNELYPDSVFREGVCLYGTSKIEDAEATFTRFIENFPRHDLVSECYSLRADIEAAKEDDLMALDRAQSDYRKAIDTASSPLQASYPAFQAAKTYKIEFKWQEIIDVMNYYMNRWEEDADVAEAVFWIGQAQIELGQLSEEAIPAYLDAIERFGNDPHREGVDKIIQELVKVSAQRLSEDEQESLAIKIRVKLSSIDDSRKVLRLRLEVAQAMLEGDEAVEQLSNRLMDSVDDLSITTPASLSMMCESAIKRDDVEQMKRVASYFIENFEESELLWHAYEARARALLKEGNLEGVLYTIEEAQGLFGVDPYMGWAQIIKADTLYKMGRYEEAQEAYNMVLNVAQWRGPLTAEATYGMGRTYLARDNYASAHQFFQRTYLLFNAYENGDWACKGYIAAAECLLKLGRKQDAINTLKDMLENDYTNKNPMADRVREQLENLGGQ